MAQEQKGDALVEAVRDARTIIRTVGKHCQSLEELDDLLTSAVEAADDGRPAMVKVIIDNIKKKS